MLTDAEKLRRFEKALEYGGPTHRLSDVADLIRDHKAQWWSNGDGMIVTQIDTTPLLKAVRYWLIAGDLKHCLALEDEINSWAIGEHCTVAVATGRKGWGRAAAPTGWKPWLPNFYKDLVP